MRKLTGYIGAMIIVFALMGSILAGYALNINGTSTVMNEYEMVTDVSGLYTHSQEPSYIDYNPASNYIGYSLNALPSTTITNLTDAGNGNLYYKWYTGGFSGITTLSWSNGIVYLDGNAVSYANTTDNQNGAHFVIAYGENVNIYVYNPGPDRKTGVLELTDWTGGTPTTTTYYHNSFDIQYSGNTVNIIRGGSVAYSVYCRNLMIPHDSGDQAFIWTHDAYITSNTDYSTPMGVTPTVEQVTEYNGELAINPLYRVLAGGNPWYAFVVPKTVNYVWNTDPGINYTESNRVNNYPIETDYDTSITNVTSQLNLQALGVYDYYTGGEWIVKQGTYNNSQNGTSVSGNYQFCAPKYNSSSLNPAVDCIHKYKLSDVLNLADIPADTTIIRIDNSTLTKHQVSGSFIYSTMSVQFKDYMLDSFLVFTDGTTNDNTLEVMDKYLIYNISTGLVDVYNTQGIKINTYDINNTYIQFIDDTGSFGRIGYTIDQNATSSATYYSKANRLQPTINLTMSVTGVITDTHYSDITKGYSIKSDNVSNVIWDNEYTNGNIQLLFRADNTITTYSNTIRVSNKDISIDYNGSRFFVTLNAGDPVDVGTWRNIILDINLNNGKLSAIPIRTFNSFTNVRTDNTNIFIGDLVGAAPTNTIEWLPTANSLLFNVYSTSVFMDTYGIVMVDPTLDITNYFTNLDNFYQLRLSNFSIYGQSMTINGVTGTVTGNTITFNGETVEIKDMEITYADGHAYISDSYATIDLGAIVDNNISMTGAWYFISDLYSGFTTQKVIYDWDWEQFILDDKAFGVIYIGLCLVGLIVARHFCTLTVTDYIIFVVSIVFALTVPVIA